MANWTNRGKFLMAQAFFRNTGAPTVFYLALVTAATAPTADINTLSQLTEIAAGNGYTSGGQSVSRNSTDFDTLTEDDANDKAYLQIKDYTWTASGGALPTSGDPIRYLVLTTDEATVANRQIIAWWDFGSGIVLNNTQPLTVQNTELDVTE